MRRNREDSDSDEDRGDRGDRNRSRSKAKAIAKFIGKEIAKNVRFAAHSNLRGGEDDEEC